MLTDSELNILRRRSKGNGKARISNDAVRVLRGSSVWISDYKTVREVLVSKAKLRRMLKEYIVKNVLDQLTK